MGVSGLNAERWSKETVNFLEGVAMRIENKHGRLKPQVVATEVQYQKSRAEIRHKIDHGPHFRSGFETKIILSLHYGVLLFVT